MNIEATKPMVKSKLNWTGIIAVIMGFLMAAQQVQWIDFVPQEAAAGIVSGLGVAVLIFRNFMPVKPLKGVLK
ncbi:hypothetical protein LCGC14_2120290 [marine sediment metagenome]|uniref:Uncharacterized protein n=1 Tax=marine sediment metagenome TaxID=412755 RepID=A0A0F9ERK5_9ZZZZ